MDILDEYIQTAPDPQCTLDIFKGEWSSSLSAPLDKLTAGSTPLFDDPRIRWAVDQFRGIRDKTVLELGPLEAGHTYMLEQLGAQSIVSVEANTRAYLKCLIIKELLDLKHTHFLCGDFVEYLHENHTCFDIGIASGVLYHMRNPVELIGLLSRTCERVFIWTHYYDEEIISANSVIAEHFTGSLQAEYEGFTHRLYRQEYKTSLDWNGFCGGSAPYSHWMDRESILTCLGYFGFRNIVIGLEQPQHPNGPCFSLTAVNEHLYNNSHKVSTYNIANQRHVFGGSINDDQAAKLSISDARPSKLCSSTVPGINQRDNRSIKYLFGEAKRHYCRGGIIILGVEALAFILRAIKRQVA
jgi:hypothetical protein